MAYISAIISIGRYGLPTGIWAKCNYWVLSASHIAVIAWKLKSLHNTLDVKCRPEVMTGHGAVFVLPARAMSTLHWLSQLTPSLPRPYPIALSLTLPPCHICICILQCSRSVPMHAWHASETGFSPVVYLHRGDAWSSVSYSLGQMLESCYIPCRIAYQPCSISLNVCRTSKVKGSISRKHSTEQTMVNKPMWNCRVLWMFSRKNVLIWWDNLPRTCQLPRMLHFTM